MLDPTGCDNFPPIHGVSSVNEYITDDGNARDDGERNEVSDTDNGDDGATGDDEDADAHCEDGDDAETEADDEDVVEGGVDDDDESVPARVEYVDIRLDRNYDDNVDDLG
jgi:hypothetical protein